MLTTGSSQLISLAVTGCGSITVVSVAYYASPAGFWVHCMVIVTDFFRVSPHLLAVS